MLSEHIIWVGLDVGKRDTVCVIDWLDDNQELNRNKGLTSLAVKHITNTREGVKDFFTWLKANQKHIEERLHPQRKVVYRLVMESTGCYSYRLIKQLKAAKPDSYIALINPAKVPAFKKFNDIESKTDKLDAQCLARLGTTQKPDAMYEMPADYAGLKRLTRMNASLTKISTILKNQLTNLDDPGERQIFQNLLKSVEEQLDGLVVKIREYLRSHAALQERVTKLDSIPGIGMIIAATLIAEYGPEDRFQNIRQVVSFAGMNPKNKCSGTSVKSTRLSKQGAPVIRQMLYMATLTAQARIPILDALSKRLTNLTPMQKRCAVMRKLLMICWSVLCGTENYKEYQPSSKKLVPYEAPATTKRRIKRERKKRSFSPENDAD